ncbi:MAG: histidine ammonia-lyase [Thermoanaerobaculia bacterium]|nr:histidine ammonia-lyase [Thermoanaerobaculia bacterium]
MLAVDGRTLTLESFASVVREGERASLSEDARERIRRGREVVETALARGEAIYGLNTGFGDLANVRIPEDKLLDLQERLILSHAAGVGEPLSEEVVRGMLLLRANTLARGHSGVRTELVEALLELLNAEVHPVIPARGSVGASGDLAPLAHLALPLLGRGEVWIQGETRPAPEGLRNAGLEPLILRPKEGLALINGTQAMTSILALACLDGRRIVRQADLVGALSTDALRGTDAAFDSRIHRLRPHPGQQASAENLWNLLQGSEIRESHRTGDIRVQDPYCLRCMPQVHGAARDVLGDVAEKVVVEMNAVTDNPLVFPEGDLISGGNFHGEPMALAADSLAVALAEIGSISERRLEKLTNEAFSGLPPFLAPDAGVNSGFMIAQVTAASLVSENKILAHPAAVDSIPTSADKEDHVSMGMTGALKLERIVDHVQKILAIEMLAAAQGIDLLRPLRSSEPLEALHTEIRSRVPVWEEDRQMGPDLRTAEELLRSGLEEQWTDLT